MTYTIHGSHGDFEVTAEGFPINPPPGDYKGILQVNISEYCHWHLQMWPTEEISTDVDILNVGYWYKSRRTGYEPPDEDHRELVVKMHYEGNWQGGPISKEVRKVLKGAKR